jgi:hypothetical protein
MIHATSIIASGGSPVAFLSGKTRRSGVLDDTIWHAQGHFEIPQLRAVNSILFWLEFPSSMREF